MKVFISYGRKDLEQVKSLAQDIGALGHHVWFDQDLSGGQAWWDRILASIRDCEAFVFALAPESLDSRACTLEYAYAAQLCKSILPVMVTDGVAADLIPPALAQIHYVDYRTPDKPAVLALLKAVNGLPSSPPLPDPMPEPPAVPISYLASLRELVESPKSLSFEEQTALFLRMKQGLKEGKRVEDILNLPIVLILPIV